MIRQRRLGGKIPIHCTKKTRNTITSTKGIWERALTSKGWCVLYLVWDGNETLLHGAVSLKINTWMLDENMSRDANLGVALF